LDLLMVDFLFSLPRWFSPRSGVFFFLGPRACLLPPARTWSVVFFGLPAVFFFFPPGALRSHLTGVLFRGEGVLALLGGRRSCAFSPPGLPGSRNSSGPLFSARGPLFPPPPFIAQVCWPGSLPLFSRGQTQNSFFFSPLQQRPSPQLSLSPPPRPGTPETPQHLRNRFFPPRQKQGNSPLPFS